MKIHVLVYDQFANFEVVLVGWMKSNNIELVTMSLGQDYATSIEGFKVIADKKINEVDPKEVELFLIPGGDAPSILGNEDLQQFIKTVNENGKVIGAICYAPVLLGEAGVLEKKQFTTSVGADNDQFAVFNGGNFTNEDVTVDGNIITAKGNAYVEFSLEVCKKMNLTKLEHLEYYGKFFKNVKEPVVG